MDACGVNANRSQQTLLPVLCSSTSTSEEKSVQFRMTLTLLYELATTLSEPRAIHRCTILLLQ